MKGQWCERNKTVFCQESSGCDNCMVSPEIIYQAKIETHNLNKIETEPHKLATIRNSNLQELIKSTSNIIRDNAPLLYGGFTITTSYTKVN